MKWVARRLSDWLALTLRAPDVERMKKERNVTLLIEALEYPLPKVRWAATRALGQLWDIPDLVKLGQPNSQKVRAEAAEALGLAGDKRVVAALTAALFDPVASSTDQLKRSIYPVRMNAITALCEIGDPCAIEPLLEALGQKSWYGQTLGFQGKLCENILKMGEPMLLHCMTLLQSPDPVMRQQAIYVLECFSSPRTIEPLAHFLMREQDHNLQAVALRIISGMPDNLAIPTLITLLQQTPNSALKENLVNSLSKFKDERIKSELLNALRKTEQPWLSGMINYIVKFGSPSARAALAEYQAEAVNGHPKEAKSRFKQTYTRVVTAN